MLSGQLGFARDREIEMELLADGGVGPGGARECVDLLERHPRYAGRVDEHQPVPPLRVVPGWRRLVAGSVRIPEQISVELGQGSGVGGIEHHLS